MTKTGWIGEDPDEQAPAMPTTSFLLANRADPGQGRTLGEVLARALQAPDRGGPEPEDPDDRYAGMVTRGYSPGLISQLSMRLGDIEAEMADEQGKLERGARRAEHVMRAHQAGRVRAWDIPQLLGDDLGDEGRVRQLARQADTLRQQIEQASAAIAPPSRRDPDPLEAASQRAHAAFAEHTRSLLATRAAAAPRARSRRPFAGEAARSEVTCAECITAGATAAESFLLHSDPQPAEPPAVPDEAEVAFMRDLGYDVRAERRGRGACEGTVISR